MNEKKKAKKLEEVTVDEAKELLAQTASDDDNLVWGTLHRGTKAEAEAFLASAADGDAIVWGN